MDDLNDPDDHDAVQGLLDFAQTATAIRADQISSRGSEQRRASTSGRGNLKAAFSASKLPAFSAAAVGGGRTVTSGSNSLVAKAARPTGSPRQPETKIEPISEPTAPLSVFATQIGSGDSGKSSTEFTPFAITPAKAGSGSESETESDEQQAELTVVGRPAKKPKLTREISINAVLQRVGSKEAPLADCAGKAPQTVQEMVPPLFTGKAKDSRPDVGVDTLSLVHKLWGSQPKAAPTKRRLSEPARPVTSHTSSPEHALHLPPKPPAPAGLVSPTELSVAATKSKEAAEEAPKTALWRGKVKHLLKTAEGASVVELFNLQALVPEKLLEQMPPTLFVSTLAARANVKLGKHYVTQCRLEELSEKQHQKVLALANMKLVAICELQQCTLTLAPFTDRHQGLRIVGFMIADE